MLIWVRSLPPMCGAAGVLDDAPVRVKGGRK